MTPRPPTGLDLVRLEPSATRRVVAVATGLLVLVGVLALSTLEGFSGLPSIALAVLLLLGTPSARYLSRRLAINGIAVLGFGPMLWWAPWPPDWTVTHSGLLLGAGAAFLAAWAVWRGRRAARVLPGLRSGDIATLATVAFVVWFFRPFFTHTSGLDAVSLLRQAFDGDNVAHFNMFGMIRLLGGTGPNWPAPLDGTIFAYVPYPQHFHALVAQVAELMAGPVRLTVEGEAGLFIAGSATIISLAIVTLVAAAASLGALRDRPGLSLVVAAGAVSFLLLGFGAHSLSYGFPPYLLAMIGTLIGLVFALQPGRSTVFSVLGSAASTVLVAHTWSLLAPLVGVGLLWGLIRLPWRVRGARGRLLAVALGAIAVVGAAGGWALFLVFSATSTVGSFAEVLSIPGASPTASIPLTLGLAGALVGVAVLMHRRRPSRRMGWLIAGVACLGVVQAALLIAVQLSQAGELSYFQIKFVNALFVLFALLLVVMSALLVAEARPRALTAPSRAAASSLVAIAVAIVVIVSGLPVSLHPALTTSTAPGIVFREEAAAESQRHLERTVRLIAASQVMTTQPCIRPIYLGGHVTDLALEESNQWAMSLSSTWTEASAPINAYLFSRNSDDNWEAAPSIARHLLAETPDNCLVVAPDVRAHLVEELDESSSERVFTW